MDVHVCVCVYICTYNISHLRLVGLELRGKDRNFGVYVTELFLNNPFKSF